MLANLFTKESLAPKFVELEPGFKPQRPSSGNAGADVKAYIPDSCSEAEMQYIKDYYQTLIFNFEKMAKPLPKIFINGNEWFFSSPYSAGTELLEKIEECQPELKFKIILPGNNNLFRLGFKIALPILPEPWVGEYQIRSRSGWAIKYGLVVTNQPGTVDANYRGEVMTNITNLRSDLHVITHGTRIGQGIYNIVVDQSLYGEETVVKELDTTERGEGGFGSTGV